MDVWGWTPNDWDSISWRPLWLGGGGGINLAEGLRNCGKRSLPLLNYTLAFALQLRGSTENIIKGSRIVWDTSRYVDFSTFLGTASTDLLSIIPARLNVGDFGQPLVGTSVSQFSDIDLRGPPHQLTFSQSSQLVLWWGRRKWNPQILVNLPVTNAQWCVSRNVQTLGL
jgi:hypothetical protein